MKLVLAHATRRIPLLAGAAALALGLSACGEKSHPHEGDGEAVYVDAGPVSYQVQLSRQLNPFATEDKGYLAGVSAPPPATGEAWFVVFLWAKNQSKSSATTTDQIDITDADGTTYYPVPINSQVNPYAWTTQTLGPGGTEPAPDTTASYGPTQGGELLFKLSDTAYSNRPLTLNIYAPGQAKPSTVSLDL